MRISGDRERLEEGPLRQFIRLLIIIGGDHYRRRLYLIMQYDELYGQNRLSAQALRYCGFEEAPSSSLPYYLYKAELNQQACCLRDTLILALRNYQKLQNILLEAGTARRWKFYHIVLCTMPDKASRTTHKEAIDEIIRLNSMWQVATFRTFFVPIGMGDSDIEEILRFCEFGGPDWVSYPTTYEDFHDQFRSVMAEVGIGSKSSLIGSEATQEGLLAVNPFENSSLAVTLSVEASEMMRGQKWEHIVGTISFYLRNLSQRDVMSGIIFSSQPWVVGQLVLEQDYPQIAHQEQIPRGPPPQPHPQNMRAAQPQNMRAAQPQNMRAAQPQYVAYAQPVQRQGNAGRNCGYCCAVFCVLFFIRLIIVLASSS